MTTEVYIRSRVHYFGKVAETSREAYHDIYDTLGKDKLKFMTVFSVMDHAQI